MQRADSVWVAGCLFRVIMLCAHALHGRAGGWLINEKGAVSSTGQLTLSPPDFAGSARTIMSRVGTTRLELVNTIDVATTLVAATRAAAC